MIIKQLKKCYNNDLIYFDIGHNLLNSVNKREWVSMNEKNE